MNALYEFLFCPVHGLPAYASMILPLIGGVWTEIQLMYGRLLTIFGRYT